MKVLLSHYPVVMSGGAERGILALAVGLRRMGHDIYLYGPWSDCPQFVAVAEQAGIPVILPKRRNYVMEGLQTRRICKSFNVDVILSSSRRYNVISALSTAGLATVSVPVLHGLFSSWDSMRPLTFMRRRAVSVARMLWWLILKKAPIIVCVSEAVAQDARKAFRRSDGTTPVIYNAIERDLEVGHGYGKSGLPFTLLLVGRLHKEKRPELVVPLMQEVLKKHDDIIAQIAGEGEERSHLEALITSAGLGAQVRLLGHCEEMGKLYRSSHVLVHFRTDEGFGRAYLEAQMNRIPVVCSSGGAAAEVVVHGKTGYLHDPDDIVGMAESIIALKQNRAKYDVMCDNAEVWSRQFSFPRMLEQYEQLLERLTGQEARKRGR